ncbi:MarR family winged helix-turn-helix transcriptional regulator [Dactylosporangium sp. CA-139066]|uniref:MarR family winged helix-turn-helix transcriptional regulator n=1 Tax=Dactylosporangium sp. CA-139066 TaxID=3239930 RepID=UPI003D9501E3
MEVPHADSTPARLGGLTSWLLTQAAEHAGRLVADGFARAGARGYHYRVLAALDEFGPASQATLGRRSGIHVSDIVATVNELATTELVGRAPDPVDRRRNVITITPLGGERLARLDGHVRGVQDALLAPLSEDERAELRRLLGRLLSHHEAKSKRDA